MLSAVSRGARLIWLLEDSPVEATRAAEALSSLGEVVVFADGLALIEALRGRERLPDLLVLDWVVPGMSGIEVCEFVRREFDELTLPIVMLTGTSDRDDLVRALSLGANDFVVKPFRPDELVARLHRALKIRSLGEDAYAANLHKDRFISVLGHDLRNPLGAILGSAGLLKTTGDERTAQIGARIERNAQRMGFMVRDILHFAREQYGQALPLAPAPVSMEAVCNEVVEELRLIHPGQTMEVASVGDLMGRWDEPRLMQALSNLVGNAVQHGGGAAVLIRADGQSTDQVSVSVHNQGECIPAAEIAGLFEPFRVGSQGTGGLGLGLYVVREVVTAHGGTVAVTSSGDAGTTFLMTLPRSPSVTT